MDASETLQRAGEERHALLTAAGGGLLVIPKAVPSVHLTISAFIVVDQTTKAPQHLRLDAVCGRRRLSEHLQSACSR